MTRTRQGRATGDGDGLRPEFWRRFPLDELTRAEWEALCDGCAKCCLVKLEDEDTGEVAYTNVACRLLDLGTCRCGNYPLRRQLVAGCVVLDRDNLDRVLGWMPRTCAYRLVHEGRDLEAWHPLISGDPGERARGRRLAARPHGGGVRRRRGGLAGLRDRGGRLMWFTSDNAGPAAPEVHGGGGRRQRRPCALLRRRRGDGAGDRAAARDLRGAGGRCLPGGHRHGGERAGARLPLPALGDGVLPPPRPCQGGRVRRAGVLHRRRQADAARGRARPDRAGDAARGRWPPPGGSGCTTCRRARCR